MDNTRYDFGNNWYHFIDALDNEQIELATTELKRLVGNIKGKSFADIGSGSGLHSLAALKLGAKAVTAFDYDTMSVKATTELLSRYATGENWTATQGDILSPQTTQETYDVVYSYGVLHHTGNMWQAINNSCTLCNDHGIIAIALYIKTPFCGCWKQEKKLYSTYKFIRPLFDCMLIAGILLRKVLSGKNPLQYIKEYKTKRGMNFYTDIRDWLGGYPYESISDEELDRFMITQGFSLVRKFDTTPGIGLLGTCCGEWVYERTGKTAC